MAETTPPPSRRRTHGPVTDLESHLPADWWRTLFNALYLKTDGDVVENPENTSAEVDALIEVAKLGRDSAILDLCCGQGRHVLELARRGYSRVSGLDRSRTLIRLARSRARKENLAVRFHEGDARRFRLRASSFDCVAILGNSFGYFEDGDDDLEVLRSAARVLRPGGHLMLDLADGDWLREHFEARSWEWIDHQHFVCRERSLAADGQRLVSREVVVHAERGVIADQFYAERLYNAEVIGVLLERAGYAGVRISSGLSTQSTRNQDLGMMAYRLIVTARLEQARVSMGATPFPAVTVLFGDPSLPDSVKLDGRFNAEDYATIERLKQALESLDGYRFDYIDRHEDLVERLRRDPPAFVLNLCDEGLRNDPELELHVPALLETLNIPYTGAGPTALGFCYDKAYVSAIARTLDVAVPDETFFDPGDRGATLPSIFPALVKPVWGDSSIGITQAAVVHDAAALVNRISAVRSELPGVPLLSQEFLAGTEYSVGIVGNPDLAHDVLPVLEVDYSGLNPGLPRILSYESKWEPDSPYWNQIQYCEAKAAPEILNAMTDASQRLFRRLRCRDYARFDFRLDASGRPAGWSYAELLRRILHAGQERVAADLERSGRVPATTAVAL
jgi:D-alanine-D-alanine ligase